MIDHQRILAAMLAAARHIELAPSRYSEEPYVPQHTLDNASALNWVGYFYGVSSVASEVEVAEAIGTNHGIFMRRMVELDGGKAWLTDAKRAAENLREYAYRYHMDTFARDGEVSTEMTLPELVAQVRAIGQQVKQDSPFWSLRIEITDGSHDNRESVQYSCYMIPNHKTHQAYSSPDALLRALRGEPESPASVPGGPLPKNEAKME